MRIVMLLAKSTGGIGTHVADLTEELRALGHTVSIATDALTAETFGWDDAHLIWPDHISGMPAAARSLRELARGADVVHAHGHQAGSLAALALRTLGRRSRPALIVSLHNAVLGGPRRAALGSLTARPFAHTAQLVTGASSDLVEQASEWGAEWTELAPVPSPRVARLLAQPVAGREARQVAARELLAEAGVPVPDEPTDLILTIARIAPQKDLPTLVAATAASAAAAAAAANTDPVPDTDTDPMVLGGNTQKNEEISLRVPTQQREGEGGARTWAEQVWVVVGGGDPELRASLEQQARETQAPIYFVGAQPDPERWLQAASLFVLTSHWEARALVVQEAMAAGAPVVARDTGGLADLVDGVGTVVDGGDPGDWATAVGELFSGSQPWHTAQSAGRERARSWDDGPAIAKRWVSWYARARAMT